MNILKTKNYKKYIKYLLYVVLMFLLFFLLYKGSLLSIDAHHDGTMFNPALIVKRGGIMYKDTSTYYGILTVYIQAFFLKLFGETIMAMRISAVFFYVLCFWLYFLIFKRLLPKSFLILSEVVLLFIAPFWMTTFHSWSSVYALFFILSYMYFLIRFIESEKNYFALGIGISTGLILWCRTPCGIVFILVSIILIVFFKLFYSHNKYKEFLRFNLIGLFIAIFPVVLQMLLQGTISEWWNACISGPMSFGFRKALAEGTSNANIQVVNEGGMHTVTNKNLFATIMQSKGMHKIISVLECLFPFNNSGIFIVLPFASIYLFFNKLCVLIKKKKGNTNDGIKIKAFIILSISLCSLGSWHQYFSVSEIRHWYWAGFPMFGGMAYLIYSLFQMHKRGMRIIISITALAVLSSNTIYERISYYSDRKEKYVFEISEELCPILNGVRLSKEQLEFYMDYCELVDLIVDTRPERKIVNQTFSVLLDSMNKNDRETINESLKPVIVCNDSDYAEENSDYFMAVGIEQKYPEQELDPRLRTVYIYFPKD